MKLHHPHLFLLTVLCMGCLSGQEVALPQGNSGLSQQYPGDVGIASNPAVVFLDGFENGFGIWNGNSYGGAIITAKGVNVHGGTKAMEMTMLSPSAPGGETSLGALKTLSDGYDTLFVRYYVKFDKNADMTGHNHAFMAVLARAPGVPIAKPGIPADGYNEYTVALEPTAQREEIKAQLGIWNVYVYHPEQRSIWGDLWFPDGYVLPFGSIPGNFGPEFVPTSNVAPDRGRWICMELMVKANIPGVRDGRIAYWMDGVLLADFVGLRLRDTTALKGNVIQIGMSTVYSTYMAPTISWIDDVVVATSYIGPMAQERTKGNRGGR